jgi:hypothetical protein
MGFAEALSDDGSLTGRGHPWMRGLVCGLMTALGGIGHTLPFLIPEFHFAMTAAIVVVLIELAVIAWIRNRYMCSASAGNGERRSAVKITERTHEKDADALHAGRKSRHSEASFAGAGADLEDLR